MNSQQLQTAETRPRAEVEAWCARFQIECRERGIRVTPQRLAVYRALAEDLSHPGAESLHSRLRPQMPTLSLATVYRILESLERQGLIQRVSTTEGAGRYDAKLEPHQHLVCRRCGRTADYEARSLTRVTLPRVRAAGFTAEALDIRIVGLCDPCREASSDAPAS